MLHTSLSVEASARNARQVSEAEWEELLTSACLMLAHASPMMMKSVSVTGRLKGIEGEARWLPHLCKRFADERGLGRTVQIQGTSFTVHFSRRVGTPGVMRGD